MNRLFLFFFLLSLKAWSQIGLPIQQSVLPKNNLVVNYDFSKPATFTRGSATVTNVAGTASGNASIFNGPNFMNSLGFVSFNGINQYLVTPNIRTYFKSVNATVQKSFTMSLWIYPTNLNGVIVSEHESQTLSSGFFTSNIELVNGVVKFKIWNSVPVNSTAVSLNQWQHIAMVYDGSSLKGYLNGVLQGAQVHDRGIPISGQFYAIGASTITNMGSGAFGKFNLAQFKIYNLPLNDKDVVQEYESGKTELDYTIHSPATNSNPTYWNVSTNWNNETTFNQDHYTPWLNNTRLGWAALYNDANQWITLSYDQPAYIKGIVTQGRANNSNQWVTSAHIDVSMNGTNWTRAVTNATLNSNSTDDVKVAFSTPLLAKYVRVSPVTWVNHITMRLGIIIESKSIAPDGLTVGTASTSAYQIKQDYPNATDGFYWIKNANINGGAPFKIYADMTTDGGGWTLILKNSSSSGWTYSSAIATNTSMPFTTNAEVIQTPTANYSIIGWADYIKKSASGFQYMIDATTRNSYGGIWTANGNYSFVQTNNSQTNVTLNTKFGNWNYVSEDGIMERMPWYSTTAGGGCGTITTDNGTGNWWGTLVSICPGWIPTPWIDNAGGGTPNGNPGILWYWVR